jgi:hypothetical protein
MTASLVAARHARDRQRRARRDARVGRQALLSPSAPDACLAQHFGVGNRRPALRRRSDVIVEARQRDPAVAVMQRGERLAENLQRVVDRAAELAAMQLRRRSLDHELERE